MGNLPKLAGLVGGEAGYRTQHTLGSVLLLCNYISMGREVTKLTLYGVVSIKEAEIWERTIHQKH